jgi:hypothetical protein
MRLHWAALETPLPRRAQVKLARSGRRSTEKRSEGEWEKKRGWPM